MSQEKEIKKEQEEVEEALKENEAQSEDAVENENTAEASKETADADTTDKASEEVKEEGKKSLFGKKKNPLQDKLDDMTDKYKRQLAEFENFRNRTEKEKSQMFDAGAGNVLTKILPVVDNFERGLAAVPEDKKDDSLVQGFDMIYKQLLKTLEDMDVKPIEALGKEFDPNLHNAVMQVESDEYEEGIVAQELQKGYTYHDTVIRHSMVAVAK
ncbi:MULTISPECIES: nucleotide exchange factor GrpE [Butyrivibrio]|uniref:Protein GrpE n=1 Tax=Butyrivibrio fibrisolvens TaxID=831 RepID=A0A1H9NYC3_BUTFI|nr:MULTISPECIES: nucleotide exchange factor GrpE [Butyrivibrio]MCR4635308.1 nucleotide exchange factor GrpE [Butyrivibrio sp.]PWT26877.1 nucleotide exchange factor GrpE [Butyrivibrio fibrisolvens]SEP57312.1 molecular chaperone GrpE [Butyrivibrio sp. TB]SER40861.1 molecular chaperone GrpE [Butyrivibrio fibrisolvens]